MALKTPNPSIKQYRGRTVDHIAFDGMVDDGRDTLLTQLMVLPNQSGALVTGIQKLTQRFLFELMTDKGSLVYLPDRGSTFMLEGRAGFWRTVTDVEQSFYGALLDVTTNLIGEEDVDDPPDEKFAKAELLAVSVLADQVTMRVLLTSRAGTSREIIYPLRVNSIGLN